MKEASFYEKLDEGDVHCFLCSRHCRIKPGERGKCGVRENRAGVLETLVYARPVAANADPVEKKPLYHFHPGSKAYSIGTAGCNFTCSFCQNADIAQSPGETGAIAGREVRPHQVVANAKSHGCASIAYTYTEPTIFMEYALDTCIAAHAEGIHNIFVTNGYMTEQALDAVTPYLDAANVDLKSFRDEFYRERCGARIGPVKKTIRAMKDKGVWVEVTTLVIPGLNDDPGELRELADFLAQVGPETPWHVSAFHPTHRLTDRGPTPAETLTRAREIGLEAGLWYVYVGNVPGNAGRHTYCPECGEELVNRGGFRARASGVSGAACVGCGKGVSGVGL
jgi:pyruvate formate lyase activating enzyme